MTGYDRARLLLVLSLCTAPLAAQPNCATPNLGRTPINDLGTGLYLGLYQGGLYPGGANAPPEAHRAEGVERALAVAPIAGPAGSRYLLLSIGMCNTSQEFCGPAVPPCTTRSFVGKAALDGRVDHGELAIVNGAHGGQTATLWESASNAAYQWIEDNALTPAGYTEEQVQIVWVKVANAGPASGLPAADADAFALVSSLGNIARAAKVRYPNLRMVFVSSRIFAGYATTALNPEPYAYESGFAVKWLIEAQVDQMAGGGIDPRAGDLDYGTVAPWLVWGPYLWADGPNPRSDGLTWDCPADYENDGTHPGDGAEEKVGQRLLDFFLTSPFGSPWFHAPVFADGFETGDTSAWTLTSPSPGSGAEPKAPGR